MLYMFITPMGVGGDQILGGLPDKKSIIYENFARLKADFLLHYIRILQICPGN